MRVMQPHAFMHGQQHALNDHRHVTTVQMLLAAQLHTLLAASPADRNLPQSSGYSAGFTSKAIVAMTTCNPGCYHYCMLFMPMSPRLPRGTLGPS